MIQPQSRQIPKKDAPLPEQIKALQQNDENLYNILAVDVWALAKTMDDYYPGFWAAFMKNREQAMKRFIMAKSKARKAQQTDTVTSR